MLLALACTAGEAHAGAVGLSDSDKRALVEDHNRKRAELARGKLPGQPPAANMNAMVWDDGLAEVAQAWAESCRWEHNPQRAQQLDPRKTRFRLDPERSTVGENLYAATGAEPEIELLLGGQQSWWNENRHYDFARNSCAKVCGHYTQMAWAGTRYLGCGLAVCSSMKGASGGALSFLVCNYYAAGNTVGKRPYQEGRACTACDGDRKSCDQGLCTGCMAQAFDFCSDHLANCEELAGSCPADCDLNSEQLLCAGCRSTCNTCPAALRDPAESCDLLPPGPTPNAR